MEMVLGDDIHKFRQLAGVVAARGLLPLLQGDFQSRGRSQHCRSRMWQLCFEQNFFPQRIDSGLHTCSLYHVSSASWLAFC
eukprot:scaffold81617_cov19-Tisochrysis_lutea.AAC.1